MQPTYLQIIFVAQNDTYDIVASKTSYADIEQDPFSGDADSIKTPVCSHCAYYK